MNLLLRNKAGRAITIDVDEILEINGKSYAAAQGPRDVESALFSLDGRLSAIEAILGLKLQSLTVEQEN